MKYALNDRYYVLVDTKYSRLVAVNKLSYDTATSATAYITVNPLDSPWLADIELGRLRGLTEDEVATLQLRLLAGDSFDQYRLTEKPGISMGNTDALARADFE